MRLPNFKKRNTSGLSKFQSKTARVQIPSWKHVNWAHSPPSPCQSTTVLWTTSPLTNASARHYINASEGGGRLSDSAPFLHVVHFSRLMYTGRWVALLRCLLRPTHAASLTPRFTVECELWSQKVSRFFLMKTNTPGMPDHTSWRCKCNFEATLNPLAITKKIQ